MASMAVPARERFRIPPVAKLREILDVKVIGHRNHEASGVLHRILIARKIELLRLWILFMTIPAGLA